MNDWRKLAVRNGLGWMVLFAIGFAAPLGAQTTDLEGWLQVPTEMIPADALVEFQENDLPTASSTPWVTPTPVFAPEGTVGPTPSLADEDEIEVKVPTLPDMSVFPNPARGLKATFRFQSPENFQYQINVFNRFGESTTLLNGEGKDLVDVVWSLEQVPEGIYYYSVMAVHPLTGTVQKIPVGRLVVEKDPEPPRPKKLRRSVVGR
jgi:hypothetical protein